MYFLAGMWQILAFILVISRKKEGAGIIAICHFLEDNRLNRRSMCGLNL